MGVVDGKHIREDQRDSGMGRKEIYQEGHRTEYTDEGSGLYQRSLLGERQFNLHVHSVLRVLCQSSSSYSNRGIVCQDPMLCN